MQNFNGHYNVSDLIAVDLVTKDEILNLAAEGRVPIAVWAENVFVWPVHYSQQDKRYRKMATHSRLCNGEWLYVRCKDLREKKFERISPEDVARHRYYKKSASLRLFRSDPQANVDIEASQSGTPGIGGRLKISLDDLWVPTDSWDLLEKETRNESENADALGIARRVYADMLVAHDRNQALGHPKNYAHKRVYLHLVRQVAHGKNSTYWVNDPDRDPDEVGHKKRLRDLAIQYRPEDANELTREISFKEFMNAFDQIKRQ